MVLWFALWIGWRGCARMRTGWKSAATKELGALVAWDVGVCSGSNRLLRGWGYVHAGSFRPKHAFHSVCLTREDRTPTTRARWAPKLRRWRGFQPKTGTAGRQREPGGHPAPSLARFLPETRSQPDTASQGGTQLRRRRGFCLKRDRNPIPRARGAPSSVVAAGFA
jgi:hypothetical protein